MDKSNQLFSLMYNGPLFILAIFWILFRIHEYRKSRVGDDEWNGLGDSSSCQCQSGG